MLKKNVIYFLSILLGFFLLLACERATIVPDPPAPPPPPPVPGKISYAGEIQPVFTEKCVRCHGVGQNSPTLAAGKSYQALMNISGMIDTINPGNSILYLEMATGGGMSLYCNKANADSVYKWIRQGAKNN